MVSSNAKVDFKMDYLVVRTLDETRRVHISEVGVLMLESTAISITAYALCELLDHKVKVIFCDQQRNPCGELIPCSGSHDSTAKIRQQIAWSSAHKEAVWTEIIRAKIRNQRDVLIHWARPQPELLTQYLLQLQPGDASNREGHAAKVYFNALFGMEFARALSTPENAALDYGYGLILSAINREVAAAGYLKQIGIFHDNVFNAYNLGCDLMEPLRPMIDNAVMKMQPQSFEKEQKRYCLARIRSANINYSFQQKQVSFTPNLQKEGATRCSMGQFCNLTKKMDSSFVSKLESKGGKSG